nr:hypothetical protein [Tanacetum cinerariifolium]
EQAPPSPVYIPYVPEPEYPEYIPPEDEVFPTEEQPLPAAASPTTDSPRYIPKSDPDEDPEEDPADYLVDPDDEDEEEPSGDDAAEEDEEQDEDDDDEEEEHPASADSIPPPLVLCVTARISSRPQPPTLFFTKEDAESITLILPIPLHAALPPLQLLSSDHRADRLELTLLPRKRLSIVHCPRYKAGESSVAAAARPIEGRRADYGFVDSVKAEIRRQIAKDIGYGVNTRVTELAAVQEQDTQDIYGVIEDTQGRQMEIFHRVEALVDDSQYHYETDRLVDQEAIVSRKAWAHSVGLSSAVHFELQGYMTHTWVQDQRIDSQDTLIATLTT